MPCTLIPVFILHIQHCSVQSVCRQQYKCIKLRLWLTPSVRLRIAILEKPPQSTHLYNNKHTHKKACRVRSCVHYIRNYSLSGWNHFTSSTI
uniref:Secreted protein n=1 Tax=Rhipicephalus microplus TaxID=6941 RepID=A0A6G5A365_RHIMP